MHGLHEPKFNHPSTYKFFGEIKIFAIFFAIIFVVILVVTNFNLFAANFVALFDEEIHAVAPINASIVSENNSISSVMLDAQQRDVEIQ